MAIKRVTIEIDDSSDSNKPTTVPASLTGREPSEAKKDEATGMPTYKDDVEETDSPYDIAPAPTKIGRTFPDLVLQFINNPRAMATILTLAAFAVPVKKIESLEDLKYPLITSAILNGVWFGLHILSGLNRWIRRLFGT